MIMDCMKFGFFLVLVVFSFACGVNQLYWYYAGERDRTCTTCLDENQGNKEECADKCDRAISKYVLRFISITK